MACDFVSGFEVGAGRCFFDVAAFDGARRVDVDRDQSLGVVDHDGAARWQGDRASVCRFNLVLDLETAEQRRFIAVAFDAGGMLGHDVRHELLRLVVDVVGIDQDVADVVVEVVADSADDQTRLLVNQESAFGAAGTVNRAPEFEQVVQVPLQFGRATSDACGAGDDGHAVGVFQLVHGFFEFCAVVTFDATADATATGVVGHEHHITPRQADESGERCAFVAALFFLDLHQHFDAFFDDVLDARLAHRHASGEILFGDFFEGQKAVAVFAVVDKAGFERGLDARHDCFVDIAFALFAAFDFDFVVEEFLSVDDGQAAFFCLGGVNEHPFHGAYLHIS